MDITTVPSRMPFKSKAQRRKFAQLLVEGEITPEVFEEWNRETGGAHLPERVTKKPQRKSVRGRKRKATGPRASTKRKGTRSTVKRNTTRKKPARKQRAAR
jgi:hypothetical protein